MPSMQEMPASLAPLAGAPASMPRDRSRFSLFFLAPFRDIDHRAARQAAAKQAEREARQAAAMSAAAAARR